MENLKKFELRELCKEHGIKNYGAMTNEKMREAIRSKMATASFIEKALGRPVYEGSIVETVVKYEPEKPVIVRKSKLPELKAMRPKAGTKRSEIWDYLDGLFVKGSPIPTIKGMKKAAASHGWHKYTACLQLFEWRNYTFSI